LEVLARFQYRSDAQPSRAGHVSRRHAPEAIVIATAISAEGLVKIYRSRKSEVGALDGAELTYQSMSR
jgi:hypothetical protein